MADLRDDFKHWLIKQGLSEKTKTGRAGTVYEYIRRIDNLCNKIYKDYSIHSWQKLAENIYPVLGLHLLCQKGEIHITKDEFAKVDTFIKRFNSQLNQYKENFKDYFIVKFVFDENKIFTDYNNLVELLIEKTPPEITIFEISDSIIQINKNRNALEKFYQFLSETEYVDPNSSYYQNRTEKKWIKNFYEQLTRKLQQIKLSFTKADADILRVIIEGGTNKVPPLLKPKKNVFGYETKAHFKDVQEILGISRWTLKSLASSSEFNLTPINSDFKEYYIEDVNNYINAHFIRSEKDNLYTGTPKKKWWSTAKVQKELNCNSKKVERLRNNGYLTYLHVSPSIYLYYPDSVRRLLKKNKNKN